MATLRWPSADAMRLCCSVVLLLVVLPLLVPVLSPVRTKICLIKFTNYEQGCALLTIFPSLDCCYWWITLGGGCGDLCKLDDATGECGSQNGLSRLPLFANALVIVCFYWCHLLWILFAKEIPECSKLSCNCSFESVCTVGRSLSWVWRVHCASSDAARSEFH